MSASQNVSKSKQLLYSLQATDYGNARQRKARARYWMVRARSASRTQDDVDKCRIHEKGKAGCSARGLRSVSFCALMGKKKRCA